MSFYHLSYFLFLGAAWFTVRILKKASWKVAVSLLASYFFFGLLSPLFLGLLIAASLFNHGWARYLRHRSTSRVLWLGILVNVAVLVGSKYASTWLSWLEIDLSAPGLLVPIGVSFYTFQGISYLVDVYRGYQEEPAWPEFFLFMAFWPVILSGPICRMPEMLPQFRKADPADSSQLSEGVRRIVLGLFMKVVLADTLAGGLRPGEGVLAGFDSFKGGWSSLDVWFLCLGYGFQLFFDFAGYSHIAIGTANLFGIRLRENFQDPYRSVTPADFWNRWHMSLSSWIRDYLFFPLAILRPGTGWRSLAVIVSLTVFGLWHGFTFNFFLWGVYHGVVLALYRVVHDFRKNHLIAQRIPGAVVNTAGWALTFSLVTLSWILFRSNSLDQAIKMVSSLVSPGQASLLSGQFYGLVLLTGAGYFLWLVFRYSLQVWKPAGRSETITRVATGIALVAAILMIVIWSDRSTPFVYVRF